MSEIREISSGATKIESRHDDLEVIDAASQCFFFIAALHGVSYFFDFLLERGWSAPEGGWIAPYDSPLYAIGGLLFRRYNSRAAAVFLLIISVDSLIAGFSKSGRLYGWGGPVLLALFALWGAILAVKATFKLHGRFRQTEKTENRE